MTLVEKIDFKNRKVLIIGEASIDKYVVGSANRISPDAPVPNIKIEENLNYIGGIGLAVQYIKSLGGIPEVCTIVGNDFEGDFFLKKIKALNIDSSGIIIDDNIYTPQITRIRAMNQQLLRLETDYSSVIPESLIKKFFNIVETRSSDLESILILNYGIGGLFEDIFIQKLLSKLKEIYKEIPIIARPDLSNYYIYENIDLIKMNLQKALQTFSIDCCTETSISIIGNKILNSAKCKNVLLSYLDSNSFLISKDTEKLITFNPIIKGPVRSYVSVGSIIMAILSLSYASGISVTEGVRIALFGAALSATLPPIEFFNSKKLCDYILAQSNKT
ncbi:MAG: bifunctional heptose 7-phosphate kinase/heptose 1-phosphate adenyltransferase [Candidatus Hodarchaeota archaeon]